MPLLAHGHHPKYPEQLMYTGLCDGCRAEVRFTTSASPESDLDDMDWIFDGERLLCSACNPRAPGNHTEIPSGFYTEGIDI